MSIPGLGEIPIAPAASSIRTYKLQPFWEWRFEVAFGSHLTLKLLSGTAEKDGTELAVGTPYSLTGVKSKILTYHGCELEVEGPCDDEFVREYAIPEESPMNSYLNLHFKLTSLRATAERSHTDGPRVMVVSPPTTGKTSLVRTLAAYATRMGAQPLVVNADPKEGMLTLPGTLSASVFASVMDIESGDGWGSTPSSGPSAVPVKLPLVFYHGKATPEEDVELYRELVSRLANSVTARFNQDSAVRSSGMIIDTPGISEKSKTGLDCLAHIAEELSVNIIIVLGSSRMNAELTKRFANEKTSVGEAIYVVLLDKSDGVVERDEAFMQQAQEAVIKEYFFGDSRRTLSSLTQQVDLDSLLIYQSILEFGTTHSLVQADPSPLLTHWTLAMMNASVGDSPENIKTAPVLGFAYIGDVDKDRRKMKVLAPVSGRLGDRPLIWGKWPEPYINLLG